jgi:hypothetical protein
MEWLRVLLRVIRAEPISGLGDFARILSFIHRTQGVNHVGFAMAGQIIPTNSFRSAAATPQAGSPSPFRGAT